MKVKIQMTRKPAPADIRSSGMRLILKGLSPETRTEKYLASIKALNEKRTAMSKMKFLCSD